jgi:hypothetical protein
VGFMITGYAFDSEPDWDSILRVVPAEFSCRAYRHKHSPLCLLDVWQPAMDDQHWPFRSMTVVAAYTDLQDPLAHFLGELESEIDEELQCRSWFTFALEMARASAREVLAFSANDDEEDVAAIVVASGVKRAQIRERDVLLAWNGVCDALRLQVHGHDIDDLMGTRDSGITVIQDTRLSEVLDRGAMPNTLDVWASWCAYPVLGTGNDDELQRVDEEFDVAVERQGVAREAALTRPALPVVARRSGNRVWLIDTLARFYLFIGATDRALAVACELLPDLRRLGFTTRGMRWLVRVHGARSDWHRVALLYGYAEREAERERYETEFAAPSSAKRAMERENAMISTILERARKALGTDAVDALRNEGAELKYEDAAAIALLQRSPSSASGR